MKKNAFNLNSFITRLFDGCISYLEIKDFVLKKYFGLNLKAIEIKNLQRELQELNDNLINLGWIERKKVVQNDTYSHKKNLTLNAVLWSKNLENGRVINQGIITKDTGESLDFLDESRKDLKGFTSKAIETLLKLMEVKRKKALKAFSQDLSPEDMIQEGLRISILFSRVSRRHHDLRFLNAAFKMNDWYYPIIKSAHTQKLLIIYLLALTEQEISSVEMSK